MHFSLYVTVQDSYSGAERTYSYEADFPDKIPMGQIEGHAQSMLKVLDLQAHEGMDEDEDEEPEQPTQ